MFGGERPVSDSVGTVVENRQQEADIVQQQRLSLSRCRDGARGGVADRW